MLTREIESAATWDELVSVGIAIVQIESETTFQLGRLALRVTSIDVKDEHLDARADTLKEFARQIGCGYSRLKEAARVAKQVSVEVEAAFPTLQFTHWRTLVRAGATGDALIKWAETAADEGWSADRLAAELGQDAHAELDEAQWLRARKWLARSEDFAELSTDDLVEAFKFSPEHAWENIDAAAKLLDKAREAARRVFT